MDPAEESSQKSDKIGSDAALEQLRASETRFRGLIETIGDWLWEIDPEGRYTYASPRVRDILGYEPEEVLGLTFQDLMTPEEAQRVSTIVGPTIAAHEPIDLLQNALLRKDGTQVVVETSGQPVFDEQGVFQGYRGIDRDLTARRRAEKEREWSLSVLESALDSTADGVLIVDLGGKIVSRNRKFADIWGIPESILAFEDDQKALEYVMSEIVDPEAFIAEVERLYADPRAESFDVIDLVDGRSLERYSQPHRMGDEIVGRVWSFRDVTERGNAEEALRLNESRLEALLTLSQMNGASERELTTFAMEEAVRLTKSKVGYVAFVNDDESVLTMHAWSKQAMDECATAEKPLAYPVETTGLWGEAVRQRKPIITNDYAAPNPLKKGCPKGHVRIENHMNVPIFDGDHIVMVAGVGNKDSAYDESDVRQLTLLMGGVWRALQRHSANEQLRASEERYRGVYETAPIAFVVWDGEFRVTDWNDKAQNIFGWSKDEVMGRNFFEFLVPEQVRAQVEGVARSLLETQLTARLVNQNLTKTGRTIVCEWNNSVLRDSSGFTVGALSLALDVTERTRAEEYKRVLERRLEEQKRRFYRETIFSVTDGKLQICEPADLRPHIVGSTLRFEVREPMDVGSVRSQLRAFCRERGMDDDSIESFVLGAGEAITNALRHGKRGQVHFGASDDEIWVAVVDNGPGIESLILPKATLRRGFSTKPSLGLGYSIMLDVADRVLLKTGSSGTTVVLMKNLREKLPDLKAIPDTWDQVPNVAI